MKPRSLLSLVIILAIAIGVIDSFYIVRQTEQAIIFQFRDVIRVVENPGIHFKVPFIQSAQYFERRVLAVDAPSQEIMLAEQKPLEVDAFARYKIKDPLLYYQRLRNENIAKDRLGSLLNAETRSVLGKIKLAQLLSEERVQVMQDITDRMNKEVDGFGIEIIDVRIRRADLPEKTGNAVFARMQSERQQEAAQIRAQGKQEALETTASADREATIIVAEAKGKAEQLKGEGDKKALQIMAKATRKDPQFYGFWRSLLAYKEGLKPDNTTYVLSPDSSFFKYFEGRTPK